MLPYSPRIISVQNWNNQFKIGHWDFLWGNDEQVRYNHIRNLLTAGYKCAAKSILDLGCGQGNLYKYLQDDKSINYLGVDISISAIDKAIELFREAQKFVCMDLCKYEPQIHYDFIIFNESLYYLEMPIAIIKRYKKFLTPKGRIIISMWYDKIKNNKLWSRIDSNFEIERQETINNGKGTSWIIKVLL